jgi:N-acyl-D-amino-acid deacylase
VRYYDGFKRKAKSVFPEHNGEEVDPPYGKGALEVMDSHGGWIASAPDLVRFGVAIDFPDKFPAFAGELCKSRFKVPYGHSGGLDGTSTYWKRSPNGVTWALLFNSQAAPGITWLVDGIRTDLEKALQEVKEWPAGDLFGEMGYDMVDGRK